MNSGIIIPTYDKRFDIVSYQGIRENGVDASEEFLKEFVFDEECTVKEILEECNLEDAVTEKLSELYAQELVRLNDSIHNTEEAFALMMEDDSGFNNVLETLYKEIEIEDLKTFILGIASKKDQAK